jgi:hypothetical protein
MAEQLVIDRDLIQRAIVVLPLLKGTIRDIQQGLALRLGVQRSIGYISQSLTGGGQQAARSNEALRVPLPILAEADEIFQGRQPCLMVVNLTPAEHRDETTWGSRT